VSPSSPPTGAACWPCVLDGIGHNAEDHLHCPPSRSSFEGARPGGWLSLSASLPPRMRVAPHSNKSHFNFIGTCPGHRHHAGTGCFWCASSVPASDRSEFIAYAKATRARSHGVGRTALRNTLRRTVQDDGRHRFGPRAISGRGPSMTSTRWTGEVIFSIVTSPSSTSGPTSCARWRDDGDTLGGTARHPTLADFLPGYEASGWQGVGVPKNTPAEIIDKLNKELNAGLADPKIKTRLAELGGTILGGLARRFRRSSRRPREVGQSGQAAISSRIEVDPQAIIFDKRIRACRRVSASLNLTPPTAAWGQQRRIDRPWCVSAILR